MSGVFGERTCGCGTHDQAVERAAGMLRQMVIDGECPMFGLAVGVALSQLSAEYLSNAKDNYAAEGDFEMAIITGAKVAAAVNVVAEKAKDRSGSLGKELGDIYEAQDAEQGDQPPN